MGIDYEKFVNAASDSKVQREIDKIRKNLGDRKIILSIDRLDYTKSIPQRLEAFDLFLDKYPEFREKVTFIVVAVPSRTKVEHYRLLKKQVDELIGKINGKYGTFAIYFMFLYFPGVILRSEKVLLNTPIHKEIVGTVKICELNRVFLISPFR